MAIDLATALWLAGSRPCDILGTFSVHDASGKVLFGRADPTFRADMATIVAPTRQGPSATLAALIAANAAPTKTAAASELDACASQPGENQLICATLAECGGVKETYVTYKTAPTRLSPP
jgi:hypothetical protein